MGLVGVLLLAASCTSSDDPASGTDTTTPSTVESQTTSSVVHSASDGEPAEASDVDKALPVNIHLPVVPIVALPDLSILDDSQRDAASALGNFARGDGGLTVLDAACESDGGQLVYEGSNGTSFFDISPDGSGTYVGLGPDGTISLTIEDDGSGTYVDSGGSATTTIVVEADGSGSYASSRSGVVIAIEVEEDGSGTYRAVDVDDADTTAIEIEVGGAGSFDRTDAAGALSMSVNADGSGEYRKTGDRSATIVKSADGGFEFAATGANAETLEVLADGSGVYRRGDGLLIEVDADGNGTYTDAEGSNAFTTDIGILDPAVLTASPMPEFAVADRFPPLDTLGRLEPRCRTVLRLDADVLFDFDADELRPEAQPLLDQVGSVLTENALQVEIHGHTDAIGTSEYNLDLSQRRAVSVERALVDRGVTTIAEVFGFGETRPVASNRDSAGADNPAGRQLNRRVEVVLLDS